MSYVDNLPVWTYPWHAHDDAYELAFILSGSGSLVVGGQTLPVEAGSLAVVPPRVMHRFSAPSQHPMRYYTLRFSAQPEEGELQAFFRQLGSAATPAFSYLAHVQSVFQVLFSLHQSEDGHAGAAFQSFCLGLIQLARTLFTGEAKRIQQDDQYFASGILQYIKENRASKITLDSLAKEFGVSNSHLSRIFYSAYHISPINDLIYCRVTYATELLLKSDLSVAEIAERVGYENPTHFTNMFCKRIGCTPAEYRERNQKPPVD